SFVSFSHIGETLKGRENQCTNCNPQIDTQKAEAFGEKLLGILNGGSLALMTSIGHRTGLFDTMNGLPPSNTRRFLVQLSPQTAPAHLPAWLEEKGFTHYNNWVKLVSRINPPSAVKTDLRIKRIGADQAEEFAEINVTCLDWPPKLKPRAAQTVGRPGWRHYLTYAGNQPRSMWRVLHRRRSRCSYGCSHLTRLPRPRRAIGSHRPALHDCADAGCRWLTVDTAEPTPERPVAFFRNLSRFGFEIAYGRPNYLYQF
ncbi:hypothetical protein MJD09_12555, partial [bacterium]|nr:hypothetical protein [bacterium]